MRKSKAIEDGSKDKYKPRYMSIIVFVIDWAHGVYFVTLVKCRISNIIKFNYYSLVIFRQTCHTFVPPK